MHFSFSFVLFWLFLLDFLPLQTDTLFALRIFLLLVSVWCVWMCMCVVRVCLAIVFAELKCTHTYDIIIWENVTIMQWTSESSQKPQDRIYRVHRKTIRMFAVSFFVFHFTLNHCYHSVTLSMATSWRLLMVTEYVEFNVRIRCIYRWNLSKTKIIFHHNFVDSHSLFFFVKSGEFRYRPRKKN